MQNEYTHFWAFSPEAPVLVIGAACTDIVGRLRGDLRSGTSNPGQIRTSFGGVGHNIALNLACLGQKVRLITAVGEDDQGSRLLQAFTEVGVDTQGVMQTGQFATGSYLAVINPQGVLQFALDDMRAVNAITPAHIRKQAQLFEQASLVFLDANLSPATLRAVIARARKANLPICADPTSISLASRLKPYLPEMYLITPNSSEAAVLCDPEVKISNLGQALEAAKCLVNQGVKIAIITLAEQGLCYATSETSGHIPAIRTEIVDPAGAGDALTAAVIFALVNAIPLDDAVRLGVSAASLTLRHSGAVAPDLTLEKLYDQLVI